MGLASTLLELDQQHPQGQDVPYAHYPALHGSFLSNAAAAGRCDVLVTWRERRLGGFDFKGAIAAQDRVAENAIKGCHKHMAQVIQKHDKGVGLVRAQQPEEETTPGDDKKWQRGSGGKGSGTFI